MQRRTVRLGATAGVAALAAMGALQGVAAAGAGAAPARHVKVHAKGAKGTAHAKGTVHVAKVSVGKVLVTSSGMTLYVFGRDAHKGPTCTGSCAAVWHPLLAGTKLVAGPGVKKALLGADRTKGGKRQVTYDHWPLYTFTGDTAPGQAHGQGIESFGGKWSTVGATGKSLVAVTTVTKHSGGSGGSGGSSGSGSGSGSGGGW